jgi:CDP-diacylglycerol--serine O-phosphatidyltransferase
VISFGILPATIGYAIYDKWGVHTPLHTAITVGVLGCYVLAGLIRLAYFNVTEEEMQARGEKRTYYEGLPITMSSLFLSVSYAIFGGMERFISPIYTALLALIGAAFVLRIRLPKLKLRSAVIMGFVGLGIIIAALVLRGVI